MKLVLRDHVGNESCSYDINEPFEYESIEKFHIDFELAAIEAKLNKKYEFIFCNIAFNTESYICEQYFYKPLVYTLDNWFKQYKKN